MRDQRLVAIDARPNQAVAPLPQDSSRNIAHSSHCCQLASNCAFAASRVAARPSLRMPSGFPRTPYSDHDHLRGSAPSPS
jgi:hypothetical protein